jgi:hypothetical protein
LTFCLPRRSCPVASMLTSSRYCLLPVNATRAGAPHAPQVQPGGSSVRGQGGCGTLQCVQTHNTQLHSATAAVATSPAWGLGETRRSSTVLCQIRSVRD